MNTQNLTITCIDAITCFDITTGNYMYTIDELQKVSIAQSQDKTDIIGKGGRKLNSLKKNKSVKVSGTNGLLSGGLMESQTGGSFEKKVTEVLWTDYLTVNAEHKATTTWKAIGTTGDEISALYIKNSDNTLGKQLTQNSVAGAGQFAYAPETKELSFHTDIPEKTEVVVYYKRKINADVLANLSDEFSGKCMMFIDASAEDGCDNVYHVQFFIPRADFSGEFTMDLGDSQTVHNFEAEALAGTCGAGKELWTYTVFGENEQDAE